MKNKEQEKNQTGVGVRQVAAALMGAVTGAGLVAGAVALHTSKGKKVVKDLEKAANDGVEKGKKVVENIENAVIVGADKGKAVVEKIKEVVSEGKKEGKKTVREVKKSASKVAKKMK